MNVFVAGGSGTIGRPLVRALLAAGHRVTALTRSAQTARELEALGAQVAVADALDREALARVVAHAQPTHVVHQLTALPKEGPRRASDLDATNRLRVDGTRNLLAAAIAAGARRFVVGSFAALSPRPGAASNVVRDNAIHRDSTRPGVGANPAAAAVASMEAQVLEATRHGLIEGVILRYGMFYSLDTPSTAAMIDMVRRRRLPVVRRDNGQLPFIHVDDAVEATVLALDRAPAGSIYDIVDDRAVSAREFVETIAAYTGSPAPLRVPAWLPKLVAPYMARMMAIRAPLSNAKAKAELGWQPAHPTIRDGLAQMFRRAA